MQGLLKYFEFVRFSHTVFALPFALAAMTIAARDSNGWPGWRLFLLIIAAMVCARTAAMGFNRIVDRKIDALNPRTERRHLPSGQISLVGAWVLVMISSVAFIGVAYLINRPCFYLSPITLAVIFFYSYTKRFTDFSHFFLSIGIALAPLGAWVAVKSGFSWEPVVLSGAVVFWLVGFDIIYSTQDVEFDRSQGLHSFPARWGINRSLQFAQVAHGLMAVLLLVFGLVSRLGIPYYIGVAIILICLCVEHWLTRRRDPVSLNLAFFRMNAAISVVFLSAVIWDVVCQSQS